MMTVDRRHFTPRRVFLVVLAASLLVELAWVLSIPAFRGIDEFDHVYKAEAVAHGMWTHEGQAGDDRGYLVAVPSDVVAAAAPRCRDYSYTKRDDCRAVAHVGHGLVLVSSGAATYNPAYYFVVGNLARPFHGASADFAMRAVTALMTSLLLAAAAAVTSAWARTGWPLLALFVATTPVLAYSGALASPNGVGYAAGCLLWGSLLGLRRAPRSLHVWCAALSACVVLVTHSTGFVWVGLALLLVGVTAPFGEWRGTAARMFGSVSVASVATAVVLVLTFAWMIVNRTNDPSAVPHDGGPVPWHLVPTAFLLWGVQTIAAFPMRDQPAPLAVYALWLAPFLVVMTGGMLHACRRTRLSMGLGVAAWFLIPMTATLLTFSALGFAWQGRYALVLAVGLPALAGFVLDGRGVPVNQGLLVASACLCAVASAWSVGAVAAQEAVTPLAPDFPAAVPGAPWLLAGIALIGSLWPLALIRLRSPSREPAVSDVTEAVAA